jgi:hypothetical protein
MRADSERLMAQGYRLRAAWGLTLKAPGFGEISEP